MLLNYIYYNDYMQITRIIYNVYRG